MQSAEDQPALETLFALESLLRLPRTELRKQSRITRFQASGPGGQKRNRVLSGVRIVHPLGLRAENAESRAGEKNVEAALERLCLSALEIALPLWLSQQKTCESYGNSLLTRLTEMSAPSNSSEYPRLRPQASATHHDYPLTAWIALALLTYHQGRLAETAKPLGLSASALARLFAGQKGVLAHANAVRANFGAHPLKT